MQFRLRSLFLLTVIVALGLTAYRLCPLDYELLGPLLGIAAFFFCITISVALILKLSAASVRDAKRTAHFTQREMMTVVFVACLLTALASLLLPAVQHPN